MNIISKTTTITTTYLLDCATGTAPTTQEEAEANILAARWEAQRLAGSLGSSWFIHHDDGNCIHLTNASGALTVIDRTTGTATRTVTH